MTNAELIASLELRNGWRQADPVDELVVEDSVFNDIAFSDLLISRIEFRGCTFTNVRFDRCTIASVVFTHASLRAVCELSGCTFTNCIINNLQMRACSSVHTRVRNSILACSKIGSGQQNPDFIDCMLLACKITPHDRREGLTRSHSYPLLDRCILADCTRNAPDQPEIPPADFLPTPSIGFAFVIARSWNGAPDGLSEVLLHPNRYNLNSPYYPYLWSIYQPAYANLASRCRGSLDSGKEVDQWTRDIRRTLQYILRRPESSAFYGIPEHLQADFVDTVISILVQQLAMFEALQKS